MSWFKCISLVLVVSALCGKEFATGAAELESGASRAAEEDYFINRNVTGTATFERSDLESAQLQAEQTLLKKSPGTVIRYHPIHKTPRHIFNYTKDLTPPSVDTPENICRAFLKENAGLYRLTEDDLLSLQLDYEYETEWTGTRHLFFNQQVEDIPLDGAIHFNLSRNGEILNVSDPVVPALKGKVNATAPRLTAPEAVQRAAASIDITLKEDLKIISRETGNRQETILEKGPFERDLILHLAFYPLDEKRCRLAWKITNLIAAYRAYEFLVDAETGDVLARYSLTRHAEPVRWLVFPGESPQPLVFEEGAIRPRRSAARPDEPDRDPVGNTRREVIETNGDPDASPWGWIANVGNDLVMILEGNNAICQVKSGDKLQFVEEELQPRATVNEDDGVREFIFPLVLEEPGSSPGEFMKAETTDLFYWCNFLHDYLYDLGFDEDAGNFQTRNAQGLEGVEGDPVFAYSVYMLPRITAPSFSTFPDGQSPIMLMDFKRTNDVLPVIDSSYDHSIVVHEYCHGLSSRLVGGPRNASALSGGDIHRGLGEGWADWFALSILSREEDPPDGAFPHAAYYTQNFRSGGRRYPYSTRMDINPLSYRHLRIDPTREHPGIPSNRNPVDLTESHAAGEIWCSVLWDLRANFIEEYGFEIGKRKAEQLIVNALKRTPARPSFTDARDIIVQESLRNGDEGDPELVMRAFAKRGLGLYATEGNDNGFGRNVKESTVNPFGDMTLAQREGRLSLEVFDATRDGAGEVEVDLSTRDGRDWAGVTLVRNNEEMFTPFKGSIAIAFDNRGDVLGDDILGVTDYDEVTAVYRNGAIDIRKTLEVLVPLERVAHHEISPTIAAWSGSVVDIDGDAQSEIFVFAPRPFLFRIEDDGAGNVTLRDFADDAGLRNLEYRGQAACWGDYDNDGDLDAFIPNKFLKNDGNGHFDDATDEANIELRDDQRLFTSWIDYDVDGDLDLVVRKRYSLEIFRNNGRGSFADASWDITLFVSPSYRDPQCSWGDFDNDGDTDFFIDRVYEYERESGRFRLTELPAPNIAVVNGSSWADYDDDGDLDLLASTEAGNRLFRNTGGGAFEDVSREANLGSEYLADEPVWVDYDNDGDLDLITRYLPKDSEISLYENRGNGTFVDVTGRIRSIAVRNMLVDDITLGNADRDPMPELFIIGNKGVEILKFPANDNNYLCVKPVLLLQNGGERAAIGATVEIDLANDGNFARPGVLTGMIKGYEENGMTMAHFGLGESEEVEVRVTFPGGVVRTRENVRANQLIVIPDGEDENQPPVFDRIPEPSVEAGELLTFEISATDPEGDPLVYGVDGELPWRAEFDNASSPPRFTWETADFQGREEPYIVTFWVSDGRNPLVYLPLPIHVIGNSPPVFNQVGNRRVRAGDLVFFDVVATDPDGDALTYGADRLPDGARFVWEGRRRPYFSWTPSARQTRPEPYNVVFWVDDRVNPEVRMLVSITVTGGGNVIPPQKLQPFKDQDWWWQEQPF